MVETGRRLERHAAVEAAPNEANDVARWRKRIFRYTARANLRLNATVRDRIDQRRWIFARWNLSEQLDAVGSARRAANRAGRSQLRFDRIDDHWRILGRVE